MPAMAEEHPLPGHTRDGAEESAPVLRPVAVEAAEAISSPDSAEIEAVNGARRSIAEGLRDVLALSVIGANTKACSLAELQDPEHVLKLYRRRYQRTPHVADVVCVCLVAKVLEGGRQTVAAFRELADRLDGPVTQRVMLSITPEQAERMSDEELSAALKRAGLLSNGAPN